MTDRIRGRARQQRNMRILRASDICHICGEPGADAVDHVMPLARGGSEHSSNLKPAHHDVPNSDGRKCNREKAARVIAPVIKRSGSLDRPRQARRDDGA